MRVPTSNTVRGAPQIELLRVAPFVGTRVEWQEKVIRADNILTNEILKVLF